MAIATATTMSALKTMDPDQWDTLDKALVPFNQVSALKNDLQRDVYRGFASEALKEFGNRMVELGEERQTLTRRPWTNVDKRWKHFVVPSMKGRTMFATSTVSADWWKNNRNWFDWNCQAVKSGIGVVRIFFSEVGEETEPTPELLAEMQRQERAGVHVLYMEADGPRPARRDIILAGVTGVGWASLHSRYRAIGEGVVCGELMVDQGGMTFEEITTSRQTSELSATRELFKSYLATSKRFEDPEWFAYYFDRIGYRLVSDVRRGSTKAEVDFLLQVTGVDSESKLVDLCCGFGRLSIPIQQATNCRVLGIDQSASLLSLAEHNSNGMGRLDWIRYDIRDLHTLQPKVGQADAIICMFNSLGYFQDDDENEKVIRDAANILKPGKTLVIDVDNPDYFKGRAPGIQCHSVRATGEKLIESHTYDSMRRRRFSQFLTISEDSALQSLPMASIRLYEIEELVLILNRYGFEVRADHTFGRSSDGVIGSFSRQSSESAILVANKVR